MTDTECQKLAAIFARKRDEDGLLDVKFFFQSLSETTAEEVCAEVNSLYAAVEAGKVKPLDFGDLAWKS
ncbi:hypothetical protein [Vitreimonas flagellata]|uniref:hypothetical protein n=1 Tax=Vitreimonas flagellata TaxID=2560861 RepID=UPI0010756311|nr:hypothetical protein [Vitreimonas flagellata]